MKYKQDPPFSIQVEFTEGCNRGCSFCGLRGMRKKGTEPYYFMTKEVATRIVEEIARVHGLNTSLKVVCDFLFMCRVGVTHIPSLFT